MPERSRQKKKNPFQTRSKPCLQTKICSSLVAPVVSGSLFGKALVEFIAEEGDDDVYAGISFFEGLLNLNLEGDIFPGLTGELAISVNDLAQFDPSALESLEIEFAGAFSMDAGGVETQGTLIFNASNSLQMEPAGQ